MEKEYKTEIYFAWRHLIFLLSIAFSGMYFSYILIVNFESKWGFVLLCFAILFVLACHFNNKKVKKVFSRKAILKFKDSSFSLSMYNLKNDSLVKQLTFHWEDIKSYKVYISDDGYSYTILTIYFYHGWSKSFRFADKKSYEEAFSIESVFGIFHTYLKQYNRKNKVDKEIILVPGFYATKWGLIYLYFVGALVLVFLYLGITNPVKPDISKIGIFILGTGFYIKNLFKRKDQRVAYDDARKLG